MCLKQIPSQMMDITRLTLLVFTMNRYKLYATKPKQAIAIYRELFTEITPFEYSNLKGGTCQ